MRTNFFFEIFSYEGESVSQRNQVHQCHRIFVIAEFKDLQNQSV